jgi:hypothetical protein
VLLQQSKIELALHTSLHFFIVAKTQKVYNYTKPEVKNNCRTFAFVDLLTF